MSKLDQKITLDDIKKPLTEFGNFFYKGIVDNPGIMALLKILPPIAFGSLLMTIIFHPFSIFAFILFIINAIGTITTYSDIYTYYLLHYQSDMKKLRKVR